MRPTPLFRLYQGVAAISLPFVARTVVNRLRRAGISIDRAHERLGHATQQRPGGPLIWLHAASAGDVQSVLPLIAHMTAKNSSLHLLLTTSTVTSAQAITGHLPPRVMHQFSPLDAKGPLDRFMKRWRPDACALVDCELWPNLLDQCALRDIPVALLNTRLSDQSAQGWHRFPGTAKYVLRGIRMAHCQDRGSRDHLRHLGLAFAEQGGNLKSIVAAPRIAPATRDAAHAALGGVPIWVAAATHHGEEQQVLAAHKRLLKDHPNLRLILAPFHPERADDVIALIRQADLSYAQSSTGATLGQAVQVYLADTPGETDLWYTLSPIVFLGGSFCDAGGHTPLEPAAAHTAILHGPRNDTFAKIYAAFRIKDASIEVQDAHVLAHEVHDLLTDPSRAATLAARARTLTRDGRDVLDSLSDQLFALAGINGSDRYH